MTYEGHDLSNFPEDSWLGLRPMTRGNGAGRVDPTWLDMSNACNTLHERNRAGCDWLENHPYIPILYTIYIT
jgi:hypothetical protein